MAIIKLNELRENVLEFECETLTPMFAYGAKNAKGLKDKIIPEPEIRSSALKGLLRFWWRALQSEKDMGVLLEKEADIFGSTDLKSSFDIQVESQLKIVSDPKPSYFSGQDPIPLNGRAPQKGSIFNYLAYGVYDFARGFSPHIPPTTRFKIRFLIRLPQYEKEILEAFSCLVNFGGLGSKSRNGFGSFQVISGPSLSKDKIEFKKCSLSSYATFSEGTILMESSPVNTWEDALRKIGKAYIYSKRSLEPLHRFDKRQHLCAPLSDKGKPIVRGRQAKPYFLKVKKLENGKFVGQVLFMPYKRSRFEDFLKVCQEMNMLIQKELKG